MKTEEETMPEEHPVKTPVTPEELAEAMEAEEPVDPPVPRASDDFMDQLIARLPTGKNALGGESLVKRREVSFDFYGGDGAPGFFINPEGDFVDIELTLVSLSSKDEMDALKGLQEEVEAPYALAKKALWKLQGRVIPEDNKDLIWEGLGQTGRQLCIVAMQKNGAASEAAMGKFQRTFTVA